MDDNTEMQVVARSAGGGTRRRILDEALALFLTEGYAVGSLRRIADRVAITQAAVYYHFPAKDDLLTALLTGPLDELDELLSDAERRRDTEGTVDRRALLADVHDQLWAHRDVVRLCARDVVVARHPLFQPRLDGLRRRCAGLLAGPPPDGAALALAGAALALLVGPAVADDDLPPATRELLLDAAVRVLDTPRRRHRRGGHQQT